MTMEILMSVITIFSIACSVFFGYKAFSRNKTQDDKMDATQIATIIVKLDNIGSSVDEIKADSKLTKRDVQELRENIIKLQSKVDTLEDIVYKEKV